jgi:hypothetical protein
MSESAGQDTAVPRGTAIGRRFLRVPFDILHAIVVGFAVDGRDCRTRPEDLRQQGKAIVGPKAFLCT